MNIDDRVRSLIKEGASALRERINIGEIVEGGGEAYKYWKRDDRWN